MTRSLNRVELIGNLTKDPELKTTIKGTAVCSFSLATDRTWTIESGEKREETEFHRVVSWDKVAELCSKLLQKGSRVYIEGRLATRKFINQAGVEIVNTEIVLDDFINLGHKTNNYTPVEDQV